MAKVVVITGASAGIGRATAREFARHGCAVALGAVYQPEVAARAIWKAAHSKRKEWIVGAPAYQAIFGDKIASPLLDRQLARSGVEGQQSPEPLESNRKDNCSSRCPETMARTAASAPRRAAVLRCSGRARTAA